MKVVVAPATPPGVSALAVVRLTGPGALDVACKVATPLRAASIRARRPVRVALSDAAGTFDDAVLLFWAAPRSSTGEDLVEVTCHGNPVIVDRLVAACVDAGAAVAEPGEFTRRALVNGKLDLLGAEGVFLASRAASRAGLAVARQALAGALGERLRTIRADLCGAAAEIEARIDYPGDDLALADDATLSADLLAIAATCDRMAATFAAARVAVDGARVAIVGEANAGKSSLFNALVGSARALVHEAPGTTRDVVEARVRVGSLVVTLLDTAGRRAAIDPVEAAGVALAERVAEEADAVLLVLRARPEGPTTGEQRLLQETEGRARVIVWNAVDVGGRRGAPADALPTVAPTLEGVPDVLRGLEVALRGADPVSGELFVGTERQRDRLRDVARAAREAVGALPIAGAAVAADLAHEAIAALDAATGADGRDDVLSALFARFCIGK